MIERLSVVVPTYNEESNISEHYEQTKAVCELLINRGLIGDYEYLVIDNSSIDNTRIILMGLAKQDDKVKIYLNRKNYGPVRSPFKGLTLAKGDVAILIAADLQEPPDKMVEMVEVYASESDIDAVICCKDFRPSKFLLNMGRRGYYKMLQRYVLKGDSIKDFSGFGIYSKGVIRQMEALKMGEPSIRVMLPIINCKHKRLTYKHRERFKGKSSYGINGYVREAARTLALHTTLPRKMLVICLTMMAIQTVVMLPLAVLIRIMYANLIAPGVTTLLIFMASGFIPIQIALIVILLQFEDRRISEDINGDVETDALRLNLE